MKRLCVRIIFERLYSYVCEKVYNIVRSCGGFVDYYACIVAYVHLIVCMDSILGKVHSD